MDNEILNTILTTVAVPLLVALTGYLIVYLNKLTEATKAKIKDETFNKYVSIAEDAVKTSVLAISQTIVSSIKNTDQWTDEKKKEVFQQCKIQALTIMGASTSIALAEVYEDLDEWLNAKIEYYVNKNKPSC